MQETIEHELQCSGPECSRAATVVCQGRPFCIHHIERVCFEVGCWDVSGVDHVVNGVTHIYGKAQAEQGY